TTGAGHDEEATVEAGPLRVLHSHHRSTLPVLELFLTDARAPSQIRQNLVYLPDETLHSRQFALGDEPRIEDGGIDEPSHHHRLILALRFEPGILVSPDV